MFIFIREGILCSFLVEYPYVIPQPLENIPSSSSPPLSPGNPVETVTNLTKTMKLNMNKSIDGQGNRSAINKPSKLIHSDSSTAGNDKTFDTNTFVLKKKERRKMPTPATEPSLNTVKSSSIDWH